MEMANNNEEQAKNLQEQEAVIEIDVTDEAAQEVVEDDAKVEDVSEEAKESEQEDEKKDDSVVDDVQEKAAEDESVEDTEEKKEESKSDEQQQESTDEGDTKADDTDDSVDKGEVEDVADEPSDKEKELMAQIETYKEAEEDRARLVKINDIDKATTSKLNEVSAGIIEAMKKEAEKYGIPTDLSMEELEKQDATKAAIAKNLAEKARQAINNISMAIEQAREDEVAKIVFDKAEKLFNKHSLTDAQAEIAANVFLNIVAQVGVNDLDEDLAAKVKLSVAQAKMDSPDVVEVTQVKEEVKVEDVQNEEVKEEQAPAVEEEPPVEEEKVEEQKPDLSEFMEGIEGSAAKASDVNADNVLAKLNALPFKERTKFYKENMDLINEAMKNARGNL